MCSGIIQDKDLYRERVTIVRSMGGWLSLWMVQSTGKWSGRLATTLDSTEYGKKGLECWLQLVWGKGLGMRVPLYTTLLHTGQESTRKGSGVAGYNNYTTLLYVTRESEKMVRGGGGGGWLYTTVIWDRRVRKRVWGRVLAIYRCYMG